MIRFALVAVVAVAACKQANPDSCEIPANAELDVCGGTIDSPQACSPTCGGDTPVCLDGTCVGCASEADCIDSATGAIRDPASHTCGQCTAHSQCESDVCLADGSCASPDDVVYVAPAGPGPDCVRTRPCATVTIAQPMISATRPILKITGTIMDTGIDLDDVTVTIHADPGTVLTRTSTNEILRVRGTSNVSIFDLTLSNASGTNGHGIVVENEATVALERVALRDNSGFGMFATAGNLVTMRRSIVTANTKGGLSLSNLQFDIRNNVFAANGGGSSTVGGVLLSPSGTMRVFDFNTVANNLIEATSLNRGGTQCAGGAFTAHANIVTGLGAVDIQGGCTHEYGLFSGVTAPTGTGNAVGDPMFQSVAQADVGSSTYYRIQDASPAADSVPSTVTAPMLDVDGEARLQGTMFDKGADETK